MREGFATADLGGDVRVISSRCARLAGPLLRDYLLRMSSLTVWYDGGCPLCRREIALMRRLDRAGRIQFLDVATPGTLVCPIERAALLARFHALEDGRLHSGAAAFAAMWRFIPLLRPLGLLARIPLVLALLERAYLLFLRARPGLQRAVARWERA